MEKVKRKKKFLSLKTRLGFAVGEISDMVAYQGFSFLIFTFYYTVVGLNIDTITIIFILWSVINAINDPLLGAVSDKTKTEILGGGRRKPWIVGSTIPLALIMVFLFTPPMGGSTKSAIYFFFIICLFDTIYTAYSINHTSLYPEMFRTDEERENAGYIRRGVMVIGLLIAFIIPTLVIEDVANERALAKTPQEYIIAGIIFAIIILVMNAIHIKIGIIEPPLDQIEGRKTTSLGKSIKQSLKNKMFVIYVITVVTMTWYVFGLLPLIMPIYGTYVLGINNSFKISILLAIAFLSSIPGVYLWSKVDAKFGPRKAFMISTTWWIISFVPLIFLEDYNAVAIVMIFTGIGLGGAPYFLDRNISNIIDQDELKTGKRREASYFGVNALIMRLSTILTILSVSIVLNTNGWYIYEPETVTPELINGLKMVISVFPIGACIITLIGLKIFPLTKEKVQEIQRAQLEKLEYLKEQQINNKGE